MPETIYPLLNACVPFNGRSGVVKETEKVNALEVGRCNAFLCSHNISGRYYGDNTPVEKTQLG